MDYLILKLKALRFLKMSETPCPATQHHIFRRLESSVHILLYFWNI